MLMYQFVPITQSFYCLCLDNAVLTNPLFAPGQGESVLMIYDIMMLVLTEVTREVTIIIMFWCFNHCHDQRQNQSSAKGLRQVSSLVSQQTILHTRHLLGDDNSPREPERCCVTLVSIVNTNCLEC